MVKRKKAVKEKKEYPKLNAKMFGVAGGKILGLFVLLMTIVWLIVPNYAPHASLFFQEIYGFMGYQVSLLGAVLGGIYGFIDGFIFFWIMAKFYNGCCCFMKK